MTCEEALLLISGSLDHENTEEQDGLLREHLEQCPSCRAVMEAFQQADSGLLELTEEPPVGFTGSVMDAIRTQKKKHHFWKPLAVAAVLVVVIGLGAGYVPQFDPTKPEPAKARTAEPAAEAIAQTVSSLDGQTLADEMGAAVVVLTDMVPEIEVCPCQVLEDGSLLYILEQPQDAAKLSETYALELFTPETITDTGSYAWLK